MRILVYMLLTASMISVASAELLQNPDFDAGSTNWGNKSAWGTYFYNDGPDTIASLGGWGNDVDWSNTGLWQDAGNTFVADTVYTLSATWRDGTSPLDNIRLTFQDVSLGWTLVDSAIFSTHDGTNWYTSTLEFDTSTNSSVVGHQIGVGLDLTSGSGGWLHVDRISLTAMDKNAPFLSIEGTPTTSFTSNSALLSATIVDGSSTFSNAIFYLDELPVATNSAPSGTSTNVISYAAAGLLAGVHACRVDVVSADSGGAVADTHSWTFEVIPFEVTSGTPNGATAVDSAELQAVILEYVSTVANATTLYLDGAPTPATIDRSMAPTTTITYAASGLSHGVHTGKVVVVGNPTGAVTNEWSFSVVLEDSIPATLVHHWNFEEAAGTIITDVVGGADGVIVGTNHAWVAGGLDLLGGGTSGDWDPDSTITTGRGSYIDLPDGLVSALGNSVTFEATYSLETTLPGSYLWTFGSSNGGPDYSDGGTSACAFDNVSGGYARVFLWDGSNPDHVSMSDNQPASARVTALTHVVWVYDAAGTMSKLYVNGELVNVEVAGNWPLSGLTDNNSWLGRSLWGDNNMWKGKLYDFRIYNGIMTPKEVTARYSAEVLGPPSAPVIQSMMYSGGMVTLSWTADDWGSYSIMRKTDLVYDTEWSTVMSNLPFGNMTTNVPAGTSNQEFYQIQAE